MYLIELQIENFKVFEGYHKINFQTKPDKPLIIIGGDNSSGKSSIFEAIGICLLGKIFFKSRGSTSNYFVELRKRTTRTDSREYSYTNLEMKFKVTQMGKENTYLIKRNWKIDNFNLRETVSVFKNGNNINENNDKLWEILISEMIPPELPDLFFFDGEKYEKFLDFSNNGKIITESFQKLIGYKILKRLETDIDEVSDQLITKNGSRDNKNKYSKLINEISKNNKDLTQIKRKSNSFLALVEENDQKIKKLREILENNNTESGNKKRKLEQEKMVIINNQELIFSSILEKFNNLFPFLLVQDLNKNLVQQIKKSNDGQFLDEQIEFIKDVKSKYLLIDENNLFWDNYHLKTDEKEKISNHIFNHIISFLKEKKLSHSLKLDLTPKKSANLIKKIQSVDINLEKSVKKLLSDYKTNEKSNEKINSKLEITNSSKETKNVLDNLEKLIIKQNRLEDGMKLLKIKENEITMKLSNLSKKKVELKKFERISGYLNSVQRVIDKYSKDLFYRKKKIFINNLIEIYQLLSTNSNIIQSVLLDEDSLEFKLFSRENSLNSENTFSSGESQIFALSAIWALFKMIRWPMPLIIDTPLSRLDSHHRKNLVNYFFPNISNQLILFSTDTEIDKQLFEMVFSKTSQFYHIQKSLSSNSSSIKEGYYFTKEELFNEH
ncbi:MAG: DNA replication and repair protein RecF [Candidatus Heimdallarchaeota archaeon LC_3]|nr:MAG: DNA replication and repair protein RecF [Candidatus Heimdallarchaeota archaeon LC_3]